MSNDLISRKAAIAFLQSIPYIKEHPNMGELMKEWIEQIPSVQPKTGGGLTIIALNVDNMYIMEMQIIIVRIAEQKWRVREKNDKI